eukprot:PhF_6_TR38947/c0_g1_i1/m.58280
MDADQLRDLFNERTQQAKDLEMAIKTIQKHSSDMNLAIDTLKHTIEATSADVTRLKAQTATSHTKLNDEDLAKLFDSCVEEMYNSMSVFVENVHEYEFEEERERCVTWELEQIAHASEAISDIDSEERRKITIERKKLQAAIREVKLELEAKRQLEDGVMSPAAGGAPVTVNFSDRDGGDDETGSTNVETTPGGVVGGGGPMGKIIGKVLGNMTKQRDDRVTALEELRHKYHTLRKEDAARGEVLEYLHKASGCKVPSRELIEKRIALRKAQVVSHRVIEHHHAILQEVLKKNMEIEDSIMSLRRKHAM